MIKKLKKENINTVEYVNKIYSSLNWDNTEYGQSHLKKDVDFLTEEYKNHLDIGCCDGLFTKLYLEKFPNTEGYGIDHSDVSINRAKSICPLGTFQVADCLSLPFDNEMFDMVHCAQTLAHFEEPKKVIDEMFRVLKVGGIFIITTVNEFATDDVEHLWKWNLNGIKSLITNPWRVKIQMKKFFNEKSLYLMGEKL